MRLSLLTGLLAGLFFAGVGLAAAPEARADHWKKRHHHHHFQGPGWGHHKPWRHGRGYDRRGLGGGATILFGSRPRTVYIERAPRVIVVDPAPRVTQSPGYGAPGYGPPLYDRPPPRRRGDDGRYCREVTKTVVIGGRLENAYGRACYQPDGSWQWVDD